MQPNVTALAKKAINAALNGNWNTAIQINEEILSKNPTDIDAKLRLGRAFIQTKQTQKAKKMFSEVLKLDPINQVAKKNLGLISKKISGGGENNQQSARSLIKEPGTSQEVAINLSHSRITAEDFSPGDPLTLRINKKSVSIYKTEGKKVTLISAIKENSLVRKINVVKSKKGLIKANFIRGTGKKAYILFKCTIPVFKSEKQDVRPYLKKGSINEPDLEITDNITQD